MKNKKIDTTEKQKIQKRKKTCSERRKIIIDTYVYLLNIFQKHLFVSLDFSEIIFNIDDIIKDIFETEQKTNKPTENYSLYDLNNTDLKQTIIIVASQIGKYNFSLLTETILDIELLTESTSNDLAVKIFKKYEGTDLDLEKLEIFHYNQINKSSINKTTLTIEDEPKLEDKTTTTKTKKEELNEIFPTEIFSQIMDFAKSEFEEINKIETIQNSLNSEKENISKETIKDYSPTKNNEYLKKESDALIKNMNEDKRFAELVKMYCKTEESTKESINIKRKKIDEINHPKEIKEILDEYIIGQENAKKVVSQTVFNHIRIMKKNTQLQEQYIMLIGPSGCGKTEIFRTLKKCLNLNVHILDCSSLSFGGYSAAGGRHLKDYLEVVKKGDIIIFDEFDKILLKNNELRKDGNILQSEFLKLLDNDNEKYTNCLFVFVGAFDLKNFVITSKENKNIGFANQEENNKVKERKKHNEIIKLLKDFGVMTEILGRITNFIKLEELSMMNLIEILQNKNSIFAAYKKDFKESFDLNVSFKEQFIEKLIEESIENELGVRGLNSKIIDCFNNILYNIDDIETKDIIIDEDFYEKYIE